MVDINDLVSSLIPKIELLVPKAGDFKAVYTECEVDDKNLCLTDVLLKVEPIPKHLSCPDDRRYLTIVGYKLPTPIKCSSILCKGTNEEIIEILRSESLIRRIESTIPRLSDNLLDV